MKPVLLIALFSVCSLHAAALVAPTPRDVDTLINAGFGPSKPQLEKLLRSNYKPGLGSISSNAGQPAFQAWYLFEQWTALLAEHPEIQLDPAFLKAAISNSAFSADLLLNLSPQDHLSAVLENLQTLWKLNPAQFWQYSRLAIALALVYDEPVPRGWPHHQVSASAVPGPPMTLTEAFDFWIESARGGKLYNDPKDLEVGQLKFMVDVFLPADELRWAQKNARFPRSSFGKAFSSISYSHERLLNAVYSWPTELYSLAEIQKRGGICVDQAYFAAMSGKANGLPTLYFSGQGSDGGHAWFGYLKGTNRWELDCGRYENQGYAVGEARDPQTWEVINDSELTYLNKSSKHNAAFTHSEIDLGLAKLYIQNNEPELALKAFDSAINVCPENKNTWMAKGEFLTDSDARQTHYEKALNQFTGDPEMRAVIQKEIAAVYRSQGNENKAQDWERKVISQNRSGRSDLSIAAAANSLSGLVKDGKMDDAMKEYRRLLGRLGRNGGGNFYYEIVEPFVEALLKAGNSKEAERALELAQRALSPEEGSILDNEIRQLAAKIQIAK